MKKPDSEIVRVTIRGKLFSWDLSKEWETVQARKLSFSEAATIFSDPYHLYLGIDENDPTRHRIVGRSSAHRTLIVIHCDIYDDILFCNEYRIITAFSANPEEKTKYLENVKNLAQAD
jgi:uncharacterized DUF497 family protein